MAQMDSSRLVRVVAEGGAGADERAKGYRERALKIYPWICGRCAREFTHTNLRELTVHHRDHNHNNNPPDGSNWELLCLYCHDHEHEKNGMAGFGGGGTQDGPAPSTLFNPCGQRDGLISPAQD